MHSAAESYDVLHEAPDFTLLDVQSGRDNVLIRKRDNRLSIAVDTDSEQVRVEVPLRTVERLISVLSEE